MRKELHESVFNTYEFWNAFFPLLTKWKKRHFSLAKIVNKLINVENTFEIAHISQLNKLEFIFKKEKRTVWLRIVLKWAWEKGVGKRVWKQYSECTLVFCGVLFLDIIDFFTFYFYPRSRVIHALSQCNMRWYWKRPFSACKWEKNEKWQK